jgi:glyoxylase-like metal-dependent hydrolase (beta-lactamase superfamily II)
MNQIQRRTEVSRRGFLTATSSLGAAYALERILAVPARAAAWPQHNPRVSGTPLLDKGFASVRKIGEGVYATISDPTQGLQTLCNGGFVVGNDIVLLWEGFASPAGAAFQLEAVALATKASARIAVDSHYHFDHSFGNAQYGASGIPIWAHSRVAPLMVERYAALQGKDKAAIFDPVRKRIQTATSESDRDHAQSDLAAMQILFNAVDHTVLALPSRSIDPKEMPLKVDLGGVEVVLETYPGHTPGDLILRVPQQNIVFTGDLLFHRSYPVTFDADVLGWVSTLDKFARFGRGMLFVPGHGPICGQEGIESIRAVFADLADHARKMAELGASVEEAQSRYTVPERFKNFGIFAWGFCMDQAVAQFYAAARKVKP